MHAAWIGIAITIVINVVVASFTYGTVVTRLANVEDRLKSQEVVLKETTKLDTEMALVKQQLVQIGATLTRLEDFFSKGKR